LKWCCEMVTHMAVLSGLVPSGIEWLAGRIKLSAHGVKLKRLIERLVDLSVCCLGLSEVCFLGWVGVEKRVLQSDRTVVCCARWMRWCCCRWQKHILVLVLARPLSLRCWPNVNWMRIGPLTGWHECSGLELRNGSATAARGLVAWTPFSFYRTPQDAHRTDATEKSNP